MSSVTNRTLLCFILIVIVYSIYTITLSRLYYNTLFLFVKASSKVFGKKKSKASMLCSGLVYVILIAASCGTELAAYIGGVEQLSAVLAGADRLLIVSYCFGKG